MGGERETASASVTPLALGRYLAYLRMAKRLTLRNVEEATDKAVSNAYLSQLEHGKIAKPSPNVLHRLAGVYGAPYEVLMEKAGYIMEPTRRKKGEKHGTLATFATANLTREEEEELRAYLAFLRSRK
ncbi:MAG: helix-turn-helix transcriptional regulator [Thermoguttaceae bacterium]